MYWRLVGLMLWAGAAAWGGEDGAARQTLRVGTVADYAPFSFVRDGELCGFEIDMARELGRRLGYEVQWRDCAFESVLVELLLGEVDLIAAGMTITEERSRVVAFTEPYFRADPMACIYAEGKIANESVLHEKSLIVIEGYTHEAYATEVLGVEPLRLQCSADAMLALQAGQAEGFLTSRTTAQALSKLLGNGWLVLELTGTAEDCAMMLRKEDAELLKQTNTALSAMLADGTVAKLRDKWGI